MDMAAYPVSGEAMLWRVQQGVGGCQVEDLAALLFLLFFAVGRKLPAVFLLSVGLLGQERTENPLLTPSGGNVPPVL